MRRLEIQRSFNKRLLELNNEDDSPLIAQRDQHSPDDIEDTMNDDQPSMSQREESQTSIQEEAASRPETSMREIASPSKEMLPSPLRTNTRETESTKLPLPDLDSDLSYDALDLDPTPPETTPISHSASPTGDKPNTLRRSKQINGFIAS